MTRALPALLLVALVGCQSPDKSITGTDAATEASDTAGDEITPEFVSGYCSEIIGAYLPVFMKDPAQDAFCLGKPDCEYSSGIPLGDPCPNSCSCVCYQEMTFVSSCTLVECDEDSICTP